MALKPTEVDVVVEAVVQMFPGKSDFRIFLGGFSDPQIPKLSVFIAAIPEVNTPLANAQMLVRALDKNAPGALREVLDILAEADPDVAPVLARYVLELEAAATHQDPWIERLLGSAAFLDRVPFRGLLKLSIEAKQPRAILVRGPAKSGKQWTAELVRHVADRRGDAYAYVRNATTLGVGVSVARILTALGDPASAVAPVSTPDSHWHNEQCSRILQAAERNAPALSWVVVGRMGPTASPAAELCDTLLDVVTSSKTPIRLVLLTYPLDHLPDAVPAGNDVAWDRLAYGHIGEADVRDYLQWLYAVRLKRPLTEEALAAEVKRILPNGAPADETFLRAFGPTIQETTKAALLSVAL